MFKYILGKSLIDVTVKLKNIPEKKYILVRQDRFTNTTVILMYFLQLLDDEVTTKV